MYFKHIRSIPKSVHTHNSGRPMKSVKYVVVVMIGNRLCTEITAVNCNETVIFFSLSTRKFHGGGEWVLNQ